MNKQGIDMITTASNSTAWVKPCKLQANLKPLVSFIRTLSAITATSLLSAVAFAGPQAHPTLANTNISNVSTSGTTTNVVQNNNRAIMNWQSFDVSSDEAVNFTSSAGGSYTILNRIHDASASTIDGAITAVNGRVFLINGNGIIFGETAVVNLGSLIATSLDVSDTDFLNDNYILEANGEGAIINRGTINASAKGVALIGNSVANHGVIAAEIGTIVLASGSTTTLDFDGDGLMKFALNTGVNSNSDGINDAVLNSGNLSAQKILLNASDASGVFTNTINNDGIITASRIDNTGGIVRLLGNGPGKILLSENSQIVAERDVTIKSDGGSIDNNGSVYGVDYIEITTVNGGGDVNLGGNSSLSSESTVIVDSDGSISSKGSIFGPDLVALLAKGDIQNFGPITSDADPYLEAGGEIELDSDGDGVGNNTDVFPDDGNESVDTDGDGVGDNSDLFPDDNSETIDTDGDGIGDNADEFPNGEDETEDEGTGDDGNAEDDIIIVIDESSTPPSSPEDIRDDVNALVNASSNTGNTAPETIADNTAAVLGLYAVEGTGIRLPKGQETELEL